MIIHIDVVIKQSNVIPQWLIGKYPALSLNFNWFHHCSIEFIVESRDSNELKPKRKLISNLRVAPIGRVTIYLQFISDSKIGSQYELGLLCQSEFLYVRWCISGLYKKVNGNCRLMTRIRLSTVYCPFF